VGGHVVAAIDGFDPGKHGAGHDRRVQAHDRETPLGPEALPDERNALIAQFAAHIVHIGRALEHGVAAQVDALFLVVRHRRLGGDDILRRLARHAAGLVQGLGGNIIGVS
jgi:hypothetical protein